MNKNFILLSFYLCLAAGCAATAIKKEDIFLQAQQIKAAAQVEPVKTPESIPIPEAIQIPEPIRTPEAVQTPKLPYSPLPEQEKLVYKAKYLGISIGNFTFLNKGKTMINGREAYHFELAVRALPFFIKIFKAKDRYVSYMDAEKFVVLRHEEYLGGGDLLESTVDFDYDTHTATYKNFINPREKKVKLSDKILDVLSGSYYLRMIPWQLGDTVELNIYADEKIYEYVGLLHSKTTVNLPPHGIHEAHLLKPYAFLNGEQIKEISAEVLFSTTEPRKTLRASLKTILGSVYVVLTEGLEK